MVSRSDVARRAGVSVRTVSNVANGFAHVAPETRTRVLEAIAELEYRPSELARQLKTGRSGLVALVLPQLDNAYFAELTRAFVEEGAERDITVVIDQTDGDRDRERQFIDRTDQGALFDALVISPISLRPEDVEHVTSARPLVFLGERRFERFDQIVIDNSLAISDAVHHLASRGRTRIAAIGAEHGDRDASTLRLAAFQTAITQHSGLRGDAPVAWVDSFSRSEGARAAQELLNAPERPDAILCFSDELALGALRTLLSAGVRVPEDISLMGIDDIEASAYATPSLTTIRPDKRFIARAALDRVVAKLAGDTTTRLELAPHELIVREST